MLNGIKNPVMHRYLEKNFRICNMEKFCPVYSKTNNDHISEKIAPANLSITYLNK